jgi:hypothetical protein
MRSALLLPMNIAEIESEYQALADAHSTWRPSFSVHARRERVSRPSAIAAARIFAIR